MISIDDFKKIEMKIGKIVSVERVPDTDKLLKLSVDFGLKTPVSDDTAVRPEASLEEELQPSISETEGSPERDIRQVISGIAEFFDDPQVLVNKSCPFVTNLEQRKIRGFVSEAMIVAAHSKEGVFSILEPTQGEISLGTKLN